MLAMVAKANEIKALGKDPSKLTNQQLKILLASLKRDDDKIPTKKAEMLTCLAEWEACGAMTVEEVVKTQIESEENEMKNGDNNDDEDLFTEV